MPDVSLRGSMMPASPIRKLAPYAEDAKKRGIHVFHLNIGQPDLESPQQALEALHQVDLKTLAYSPSQGFASLREKMAGYYRKFGIHLTPDEILVTCGGSEALLLTFLACFNPGDEIIMTEPTYANYMGFAVAAGITVKTVTSHIEEGFALPSVEVFEEAITEKTKAILICNPNNPTGYLYTPEELFRLRDIVQKHDLFLIADEVYREFVYIDDPYVSTLTLFGIEDNVIVVDSVSKRYSECGIRVGMIVSHNAAVMKTLLKFAQARLCPPLLGQIVAEASIEGTEDYSKACFEEYKARRDFFIQELNKIPGVYSPMPEGAFYTVASLPVDDAEDFCKWCLTDFAYVPSHEGDESCITERPIDRFIARSGHESAEPAGYTVMMAPAAGFYADKSLGKRQVRMAYVLNQSELMKALIVLEAALKAYNQR